MTIRSSKFRHIFGDKNAKSYNGIPVSKNAHEQTFCDVNPKFAAVVAEQIGGGAFLILKSDRIGSVDCSTNKISKHNGPVYDVKWNPYNDNLLGSACEDGLIRLWNITDDRGVEPNHSPVQTLKGHSKRVGGIRWHPSAENILGSFSYDSTVKLWNAQTGQDFVSCEGFTNQITEISFNYNGSQVVATCKDKKLRIFDTHTGELAVEGPGHENIKVSRCVFLKDGRVFTCGFKSMSQRCCRLYDPRNMMQKLVEIDLDSSTGSLFPFYDPDLNLMYVAGKGDSNIRFFEISSEGEQIHYLNQYGSGEAQRGLGQMPKRGLDSNINEVARFYKLNVAKKLVTVIPLKVPRQSKSFADDLYVDTVGLNPAMTADEFIGGKDSEPLLAPFLELQKATSTSKGFAAVQSESSSEEVNALRAEVTSLKKSLGDRDATIAGLKEEVVQLKAKIESLEAEAVKGDESNEIAELQRNGVDLEE